MCGAYRCRTNTLPCFHDTMNTCHQNLILKKVKVWKEVGGGGGRVEGRKREGVEGSRLGRKEGAGG